MLTFGVALIPVVIALGAYCYYIYVLRYIRNCHKQLPSKIREILSISDDNATYSTELFTVAWNSRIMRCKYLDRSCIVKTTPLPEHMSFRSLLSYYSRRVTTNEIIAYKIIQNSAAGAAITPKIYYTNFNKWCCWFVIIMEDLEADVKKVCYELLHTFSENPIGDNVCGILGSLAVFHKQFMNTTLSGTQDLTTMSYSKFYPVLYTFHYCMWADKISSLCQCHRLTSLVLTQLFAKSHPFTIIHGDAHCENFLILPSAHSMDKNESTVKSTYLIDLTACRLGSPLFDVAYLFLTSVLTETRRANWVSWLNYYYELNDCGLEKPEFIAEYWRNVALIIVLHLLPMCYTEGVIPLSGPRMHIVLETKREICCQVIQAGTEDLVAGNLYPHVVKWILNFGVIYDPDFNFRQFISAQQKAEFEGWRSRMLNVHPHFRL